MEVSDKRKEILDWVAKVGEDTLEVLDQIKSSEEMDWWDELSDDEKLKISEGQKDLDDGKMIPHDRVKRKYDF